MLLPLQPQSHARQLAHEGPWGDAGCPGPAACCCYAHAHARQAVHRRCGRSQPAGTWPARRNSPDWLKPTHAYKWCCCCIRLQRQLTSAVTSRYISSRPSFSAVPYRCNTAMICLEAALYGVRSSPLTGKVRWCKQNSRQHGECVMCQLSTRLHSSMVRTCWPCQPSPSPTHLTSAMWGQRRRASATPISLVTPPARAA